MRRSGLSRWAVFLLVGGVPSLTAAAAGYALRPVPAIEIGELAALRAPPAERSELVELGPGETLGWILGRRTVLDGNEREALLRAFRGEANPRRLRSGTRVALRRTLDERLRGVDVTLNADETVRLTRDEPGAWRTERVRTPVRPDTLFVAGRIDDVLWNAIVGHPALADVPAADRALVLHRMDQVFQWQVDFSRGIREGDTFRLVFAREVRPDGSMRTGHVVAAELVNRGTSLEAYRFDPNGDGDGTYYDAEGRSVRRAFLRKPLQFRYISSRFSSSRYHPILRRRRAHRGVDYAANRGTPVMATGDGVVATAGPNGGYGNFLEIRHPNGFRTRYAHLRGFARGIRAGRRVEQGQVVAYVGSTGLATGPHLHYEMVRSGRAVDPMAIELPPGDPVPEERRDEWEERLAAGRALLERLPDAEAIRLADREGRPEPGGADVASEDGDRE